MCICAFHSITVKLNWHPHSLALSLLPNCLTHKGANHYAVTTTVFDKTRKKKKKEEAVNQHTTQHNQSQRSHSTTSALLRFSAFTNRHNLYFCYNYQIYLLALHLLFTRKLETLQTILRPSCRKWRFPVGMEVETEKSGSDGKGWSFCRMPFWQTTHTPSSSTTSMSYMHNVHPQNQNNFQSVDRSSHHSSTTVSSMAKSLLPTKRRLHLDPSNKLYFPCMCLLKLVCSWNLFGRIIFSWVMLYAFLRFFLYFIEQNEKVNTYK